MRKKAVFPVLALVLCALTACSGRYEGGYDTATSQIAIRGENYDMSAESVAPEYALEEYDVAEPSTGGGGLALNNISQESRKIVYTYDLNLQTTEFDQATDEIPKLAEAAGGFVEESYVEGSSYYDRYYSRSANYTLRIPSEGLDDFVGLLAQNYHKTSERMSTSEITAQYYDTQARLDSLRSQEARLKEMREDANDLAYMLELERELASVLYQIESIVSSLNRMDSLVSLSTIHVYLQEVGEYQDAAIRPVTFGERMGVAFGDSWAGFLRFCQSFVLFLIALLPFLPLFAVIALIVWLIVRRKRKARHRNRGPVRRPKIYPLVQEESSKPTPDGDESSQEDPPDKDE